MIIYVCYVEDVTTDNQAVDRGFLHPENRTTVRYLGWRIESAEWSKYLG